ncbi:unannotated protein [freshwater metagenome]|uniref:Unannotated protein n=1 Tax=freshwater metagenome TaxID=449393 RepID=A0A6J6AMT6_9ZZZZ
MTTIFGNFSINVTADFSDENSAYASSITSKPPTNCVLLAKVSISEIRTALPVGLFGVVMNVKVGRRDSICTAAASLSRVKSLRRVPSIHGVAVTFAIKGCIEYEGVKPRADLRPKARKID